MNIRALAARVIDDVLERGQSLATALPSAQHACAPRDRALLAELCYGVLRHLPELVTCRNALVSKPLGGKKAIVSQLILVGLYQLRHTRIPPHAAVGETVAATAELKLPGLRGLVNGVLRNYQRQQETLQAQVEAGLAKHQNHPGWLLRALQQAWPQHWQAIAQANNGRAPMDLRVNLRQHSREQYLEHLAEAGIEASALPRGKAGIRLGHPTDVHALPGFDQGWVSVQDSAAQLAAELLDPQPQERVLDACAAPGGKTAHLLECQAALAELVALDIDAERLARVEHNLQRLQMTATLHCGDAAQPKTWWNGEPFDRILLDAPCSATGVIRRHPDIKWLRRAQDIDQLAKLQADILDANWPLLKPGGTLLYATCSVMPQENRQQVAAFLARTPDAALQPLHPADSPQQPGLQLLPGVDDGDGFYYALIGKPL